MFRGAGETLKNRLKRLYRRFIASASAMIFPPKCLACGKYLETAIKGSDLESVYCSRCRPRDLPFFQPPFCSVCGVQMKDDNSQASICPACLSASPPVHRVRAAFYYRGAVQDALHLYKYAPSARACQSL